MQGKFRFSLDGVDATARQFDEVRRWLRELSASVDMRVGRMGGRVAAVEQESRSLTGEQSLADVGVSESPVVPARGGTGVRNVGDHPLSVGGRNLVYCGEDGVLGVDCSGADELTDVRDADGFIPVEALRRVGWKIYSLRDDVNLRFDDAQPVVGLVADELDDAGLGFFCEYDKDGVPVGVDYARLSVAGLRLAQEAMDEVDGLKSIVGKLVSKIDKMEEAYVRNSSIGA